MNLEAAKSIGRFTIKKLSNIGNTLSTKFADLITDKGRKGPIFWTLAGAWCAFFCAPYAMSVGATREINVSKLNEHRGRDYFKIYDPKQKDFYELRGYTGENNRIPGMMSHDDAVKIRDQMTEDLGKLSTKL